MKGKFDLEMEEITMEKYPDYIMQNLRMRLDLEPDDTSEDEKIMRMSKKKTVEEYFAWNGIIGYGSSMIDVVGDVFGVELK